jgi:hypothetical protein
VGVQTHGIIDQFCIRVLIPFCLLHFTTSATLFRIVCHMVPLLQWHCMRFGLVFYCCYSHHRYAWRQIGRCQAVTRLVKLNLPQNGKAWPRDTPKAPEKKIPIDRQAPSLDHARFDGTVLVTTDTPYSTIYSNV